MTIAHRFIGIDICKAHLDIFDDGSGQVRAHRQQCGGDSRHAGAVAACGPARDLRGDGKLRSHPAPGARGRRASPTCASTRRGRATLPVPHRRLPRPMPSTPACSPAWAGRWRWRRAKQPIRCASVWRACSAAATNWWQPVPTRRSASAIAEDERRARQHHGAYRLDRRGNPPPAGGHRPPRRQLGRTRRPAHRLQTAPASARSPRSR